MDKNAISKMLDSVDKYPFHMPGHKRNTTLTGSDFPYHRDITEIAGSDNLHSMSGVILEECNRAARLWGAERAHILVNGSTCGILAAIRAFGGHDHSVVVARNAHKSVYHGIELCRLHPVYLQPGIDPDRGICLSVTPEQVGQALQSAPDAKLVIVTSPTYEGVISDIAGIARVAHEHGAALLVDCAHGAHLGLGGFAGSVGNPVALDADVTVCSLHKTLPAPTQTALALIGKTCPDPDAMAAQLAVFQTSSPSYVLMEESARCIHLLDQQGQSLMQAWADRLSAFEQAVAGLANLRVLYRTDLPDGVWAYDSGKIVVSTRGTALSGHELAEILRNQYAIEVEMAALDYVIAMTSLADTDQGFDSLANALCEIDRTVLSADCVPNGAMPLPKVALAPWQAADLPSVAVPLARATGHVAAEYVWAYPPGVPLVVPGERIGAQLPDLLVQMHASGVALDSTHGGMPELLWVIEE